MSKVIPFVAAAATFVVTRSFQAAQGAYLLTSAVTGAFSKPKASKATEAERQASVTSLSIGETPREYLFGRACTGGSMLDGFNFGGQYGTDWECLVVSLASHPVDALEGFWIYDVYYPFTASGMQAGFSNGLDIQFVNATPGGTAPPARFSGSGWASTDRAAGETLVWFAYSAKLIEARGSRPQPRFVVRGKRLYNPLKDSTVPGGSGAHRWNDPSTHEWSENLALARYNWVRGIFGGDAVTTPQHLWVGRGLSAIEAPPERIFAAVNLCDELVPLKASGSERRYHGGGVIRADEDYATTEQRFADAMGGIIVQREGGVEIEPGAAKATVLEITDADLVSGEAVEFEDFLSDPQRINTVSARYIEPAQRWNEHGAPVRRSITDIVSDRRAKEEPLSLPFVNRGTHAQRVAEMRRRQNRLERRASIALGPRFVAVEEGDWIGWTSDRYHDGGRVVYRVETYGRAASWRKRLALREMSAAAFAWTAATDEITPGAALPPEPAAPGAVALSGVVVTAIVKGGVPGVRVTYATPVDPAIEGVRVEVRQLGQAEATPTMTRDLSGVIETTNGVPSATSVEVRLLPLAPPHRAVAAVGWTTIGSDLLIAGGLLGQGALATQDVVNWAAQVTGLGKPEDDATASNIYRSTTAPTGASLNDIWVVLVGSTPVAVRVWNGSTWLTGADLTGSNISLGIQGQGPLATLPRQESEVINIAVPVGVNTVVNSGLSRGAYGHGQPGGNFLGVKEYGINFPGYFGQRNVLYTRGYGVMPSTEYLDGYSSSPSDDLTNFRAFALEVHAGDRIFASTLLGFYRCDGGLLVSYWDGAGAIITSVLFPGGRFNGSAGEGGDPTNFDRVTAFIDILAPSIRFVTIRARMIGNGGVDPFCFQMEEMLCRVAPGQTAAPAYHPGPVDPVSDRTAANIAAGFTGQMALATQDVVIWASQVTGTGKPADNATASYVYRAISAPVGPSVNDIWIQVDGGGVALAVWAWNGTAWIKGGDITANNVAAGIFGQAVWATTSEPISKISRLRTNGRATNTFQASNGVLTGITLYRDPVYVLGSSVVSSAARISIAAHTLLGSGISASYAAGTIDGLAFNTKYAVWCYDPDLTGGAVTYVATTSPTAYIGNDDYVLVDSLTTVNSSGGAGTPPPPPPAPPGGGGVECICVEAWLPSQKQAVDTVAEDPLLMLRPDGEAMERGEIEGITFGFAPCVLLRTVSGAELPCSTTTPIEYRLAADEVGYRTKWAWEIDGSELVPVVDHQGFRWEAFDGAPAHIGVRRVAKVSARNGVFAAGRSRSAFIFTHNIKWKG